MIIVSWHKGATNHHDVISSSVTYPGTAFEIRSTSPSFKSSCPDNVPENVANFYDQGRENLEARRWDAAGAMFRKSLDVATKLLAPEHRSQTLFKRINKMVEAGTLTTAMGDWSHEIRLDGNDAVHDDEPETEADARASQRFAEAVLTYAFTLPAMVKANRAKRVPTEPESTEKMEA